MKKNLMVVLLMLVTPTLACVAVTSLLPNGGNPKIFSGSIVIQGSGVISLCNSLPDVSCTGKTTVTVLPSPEDFTLQVDQAGNFIGGQAQFNMVTDQNYTLVGNDVPCNGKLTGSSTSKYSGNIPLPAQGGPAATSATFYGSLASSGSAAAPWSCPEGSGAPSGSATVSQANISLDLQGFNPNMKEGEGGKCTFSAMPEFSSFLSSFDSTCTYTIESVTVLIRTGTSSP